jgi:hypothetical protein
MSILIRCLLFGAGVALAFQGKAAAPDAPDKPRIESVSLHVTVDAQGKVQTAKPSDPKLAPALNSAGEAFARKLTFTPARKQGVAVSGETTLTLTFALERRADGQYGLQLKRATNGPGVLKVGKTTPPKYQQGKENGALVVVAVSLLADGTPDMDTMTVERMELRVPSSFAEARYVDAIKTSLRGTQFELEKVDGVAVTARVSAPYRFGGGPAKPKPSEDERKDAKAPMKGIEDLSMNAVSTVPGVELAKIDYRAPAAPTVPAAPATPAEPAK